MNPIMTVLYKDGETDLSLTYESPIESMHIEDMFELFTKSLLAIGFPKQTIDTWGRSHFEEV
jgi:hypothetical protein